MSHECIGFHDTQGAEYIGHLAGYFDDEGEFRACYRAEHQGISVADIVPDQATPDPATDAEQDEELHAFSVDDCVCAGVDVPLQADSSSAGNSTYSSQSWPSGVGYEVAGRLACYWQATHTSDELTGTIHIRLNVERVIDQQQARAPIGDYGQRVSEQQPWCEQDPEACRIAAAEYADDRALLARQDIYVGGDGVTKPSSHHADLARLIQGPDGFLVYELGITHPELDLGDTWTMDTAAAIEASVVRLGQ